VIGLEEASFAPWRALTVVHFNLRRRASRPQLKRGSFKQQPIADPSQSTEDPPRSKDARHAADDDDVFD